MVENKLHWSCNLGEFRHHNMQWNRSLIFVEKWFCNDQTRRKIALVAVYLGYFFRISMMVFTRQSTVQWVYLCFNLLAKLSRKLASLSKLFNLELTWTAGQVKDEHVQIIQTRHISFWKLLNRNAIIGHCTWYRHCVEILEISWKWEHSFQSSGWHFTSSLHLTYYPSPMWTCLLSWFGAIIHNIWWRHNQAHVTTSNMIDASRM